MPDLRIIDIIGISECNRGSSSFYLFIEAANAGPCGSAPEVKILAHGVVSKRERGLGLFDWVPRWGIWGMRYVDVVVYRLLALS